MLNVYLDPAIFALPSQAKASDVDALIESVLEINKISDSKRFNLFKLRKTLEVLSTTNAYPIYPCLEAYFVEFGINYVQVADIMSIVDYLLSSLPVAEDSFVVNECVGDEYYSYPNYYLFGRNVAFIDVHDEFMTLLLANCEGDKCHMNHAVFTSSLDRNSEQLTAECIVQMLEPVPDWYDGPRTIDGNFFVHKSLDSIKDNVNHMGQFINSCEPFHLNVFLQDRLRPYTQESYSWAFHDDFCSSFVEIVKSQADNYEDKIVRAMICTLLNQKLEQTHKIRKSIGGGAKQISRSSDKSKGWRRDIDYDFHLHYWKKGSNIEFALVVPHNCFDIPE